MTPTFLLLLALLIGIMTTNGATNDKKDGIMKIYSFEVSFYGSTSW